MSSDQVTEKAKQTFKSVREILEKAEESTHRALNKAAPAFQKSLDSSMETAARAFEKTVKSIDGATASDQVMLFKAYRRFLGGQVSFVESRIKALEEKSQAEPQPTK